MLILGIIYFIMAVVIFIQVISLLKKSDRIDELIKSEKYRFNEYLREKKENDENKEIIERVKDNLPF